MHGAKIYSRVIAEVIASVQNTRVAFFQLENSEAISVFIKGIVPWMPQQI